MAMAVGMTTATARAKAHAKIYTEGSSKRSCRFSRGYSKGDRRLGLVQPGPESRRMDGASISCVSFFFFSFLFRLRRSCRPRGTQVRRHPWGRRAHGQKEIRIMRPLWSVSVEPAEPVRVEVWRRGLRGEEPASEGGQKIRGLHQVEIGCFTNFVIAVIQPRRRWSYLQDIPTCDIYSPSRTETERGLLRLICSKPEIPLALR